MRTDPVHRALHTITKRLASLGIPYAVAGGMALVAHGYDRTTADVDILLSAEGLAAAHRELEGLGFVAPFAGSKNLRETSTGVRIEFLIAGQYPGDGKPKAVAFPDPASASIEIETIRYLNLPKLVELKLASGISAPHRLKDLADVQELIRVLRLPEAFADQLDPSVRDKFRELRSALEHAEPE
jgi:hypothetical protein